MPRYLTSLDKASGSRFQSKNEYLLGRDPLVPGTVTACYDQIMMSSITRSWATSQETHIYFIPMCAVHPGKKTGNSCSISGLTPRRPSHITLICNPHCNIFLVDSTPIRVFNNRESIDVPFPNKQLIRIYSSLWSADDRATRGGLVKTDWTKAPFHCLLQEL
ncbi:hypothetical protein VitviT2T_017420 [Vitis vinifera]|uniref:GH16 domain-containing protein n=1 Tax=Vitis vinifera TaxID=29760 RepID=A0ABY9CUU7_VITVI|nr:hypothetical protein VitviT2T_017420 [Vitis vinifera]